MRIAHILVCHSVSPARLLASIPPREGACWYVFLHGRSREIAREAEAFCRARGGRLLAHRTNRGLARSWNDALEFGAADGCDAFLLLNDDLFFYEGGYDLFLETVGEAVALQPEVALVTPLGLEGGSSPLKGETHPQSFACGALTRSAVERIGYFDENFVPAYYEDLDYFARIWKTGMTVRTDERVLVEHDRSSTSRRLPARAARRLAEAHARNRLYMLAKWGAETPDARFATPFDDPRFNAAIPQARRHRPYGDRDILPKLANPLRFWERRA